MKWTFRTRFLKRVLFVSTLFLLFFPIDTLASEEISEIVFPEATGTFSIENIEEKVYSNPIKIKQTTQITQDTPTITFYKYDTNAKEFITLPKTYYSDDATIEGDFQPMQDLVIEGKKIDITKKLPAIKCLIYKRDEPLILLYHDSSLEAQDSTCIMIETKQDKEVLKLHKLHNTKASFVGYINTTTKKLKKCDGLLYVKKGTKIKASAVKKNRKSRSISNEPTVYAVAGVEIAPLETKAIEKKKELWLSATVSKKEIAQGEYLHYSIFLSNGGNEDIQDITMVYKLSSGLRYKKNSFTLDEQHIDDSTLSLSSRVVGQTISLLKAGEDKELGFTVYVGQKAKKEVSTEIYAYYNHNTLSHTTKVSTKIKEDLQQNTTIVGAISSDDNISLSGVRLTLENGDFVISDKQGKYHFENVSNSLHVVSVDTHTLENNVVLTACKEDIRFAKSLSSQFVNLTHTNIQNTHFCLKKSTKKAPKKSAKSAYDYKIDKKADLKMPLFTALDIQKASSKDQFLWPKEGFLPSMPTTKVAFLHGEKEKIKLFLNGKEVDLLAYDGFVKGKHKKRRISKYRGLDLDKGDNHLVVKVYNKDGSLKKEFTRMIHLSTAPVRAQLIEDKSYLVADGKHSPVIAVQFFDASGFPLRSGMVGTFRLQAPYISQERVDALEKNPLSLLQTDDKYTIEHDGIAYIKLKATSKSGEVKLHFPFQNEDEYTKAWLQSSAKEWFIVGFAQGSVAYQTLKKHMQKSDEEKLTTDGRVAFFAKGKITADVLLTMAYDSGKETDLGLVEESNSESFYTVYGDSSLQNKEAPTAKKLYLKLEKKKFYALFGDFDTGIDNTTLSKYTRRLNGIKSEYKGKGFEYTAFITNTRHLFMKDEIKADGTSGLYQLNNEDIVYASERVSIEVRDRLRPERILSRNNLTALLDYTIDYTKGTLYFKYPLLSADTSGNPRVIVVDYEIDGKEKKKISYGGRGALKFFDNRFEVGSTYLHINSGKEDNAILGVDTKVKLNAKTTLKAEYAKSQQHSDINTTSADAYLLELIHRDRDTDIRAYLKKQSKDFGLGQQNQSEDATKRYGIDGVYNFTQYMALKFAGYHDESLESNITRNVTDVRLSYAKHLLLAELGYRFVQEQHHNSSQILMGVSKRFLNQRLKLGVSYEHALDTPAQTIPNRLFLESSFIINKYAELFANHEILDTGSNESQLSRVGIKGRLWKGSVVDNALSSEQKGEALRLFNHLGMQQNVKLSKHLTLSASIDKEQTIKGEGEEDDFTSYALSVMYSKKRWSSNIKTEYKDAKEKRINFDFGVYNQRSDALGLAFGIRANSTFDSAVNTDMVDAKLSLAYRPDADFVLLDRLDMVYQREEGYLVKKLLNHALLTMKLNAYFELSTSYSFKIVQDTLAGEKVHSTRDMLGTQAQYMLSPSLSLGAHAHLLHDYTSHELSYSSGTSIGYNLFKNAILNIGYNFDGFKDADFARYDETTQGIYINMQMKLDRASLEEMLNNF